MNDLRCCVYNAIISVRLKWLNNIADKLRCSPLKKGSKKMEKEGDKEVVDKRRGDKPPLATKAPKKSQPTHELVSTCYGPCSIHATQSILYP